MKENECGNREVHVVELLNHYLLVDQENPDALYHLGRNYIALGRCDLALKPLKKALDLFPDRHKGDICFVIADLFEASRQRQEAKRWYQSGIERSETIRISSWILMGANLARLEEFSSALECYENALDAEPDEAHHELRAEARLNMGFVYRAMGDYGEALISFNDAKEMDPWDERVQDSIGELHGLEKIWNTLESLKNLKKENSPDCDNEIKKLLDWIFVQARIEFEIEDKDVTVIELLRQYLEFRKQDAEAWMIYGQALRIIGRARESLEALQVALDLSPEEDQHWVCLEIALLHAFHRSGEEAAMWFDRALSLEKNLAVLWFEKAENSATLANCEEALTCYQNALDLDDGSVKVQNIYYRMGCIWRGLGNYTQAINGFRKALLIEPTMLDSKMALQGLDGIDETIKVCRQISS
ncbi:hypothetical protein NITGR_360045 [Nitrospina gracilis 3/211]|uniref:Uncharacterized protein n=2 Tax=Nitrospinaceae TaxID=407032 RepID=M1YZ14_NITG3|nr:hypothetical protein NITGR_360045 [Nitrospina gracilis 3/211]